MTARSFVVARGEGRDREYFVGVDMEHEMICVATLIFDARRFGTKAKAAEAVAFLSENGLTGFAPSEITSGASDNLKGETA